MVALLQSVVISQINADLKKEKRKNMAKVGDWLWLDGE